MMTFIANIPGQNQTKTNKTVTVLPQPQNGHPYNSIHGENHRLQGRVTAGDVCPQLDSLILTVPSLLLPITFPPSGNRGTGRAVICPGYPSRSASSLTSYMNCSLGVSQLEEGRSGRDREGLVLCFVVLHFLQLHTTEQLAKVDKNNQPTLWTFFFLAFYSL